MLDPMNKRAGSNTRSAPLNLRVPHDIIRRLQEFAEDAGDVFTPHRLAVFALDQGLRALEKDPSLIVATLMAKRKESEGRNDATQSRPAKPARKPARRPK